MNLNNRQSIKLREWEKPKIFSSVEERESRMEKNGFKQQLFIFFFLFMVSIQIQFKTNHSHSMVHQHHLQTSMKRGRERESSYRRIWNTFSYTKLLSSPSLSIFCINFSLTLSIHPLHFLSISLLRKLFSFLFCNKCLLLQEILKCRRESFQFPNCSLNFPLIVSATR